MAEQANLPVVNTDVAVAAIVGAYETNKAPGMLWGPPGIGKTALVYAAAEMIGGSVIDFRLVTTEPVDLRGYPVVIKDDNGNPKAMAWVPADLLPKSGKGILFLDELPQAPTINMNAAAELIYDRRLGNDYNLPEGWMVMAAGNRRSDRAGTIEMATHTKNRLWHVEVKPDIEAWSRWATKKGLHEGLINFLNANVKLFHDFKPDATAFPTPRTWEQVAYYLSNENLPREVRRALIQGQVGRGAATELEAYLDRGKGLPKYEDIVANPKTAPMGNGESQAYAIVGMVGESAQMKDLDAVVTYLQRHRRELARTVVHRMINRNAEFLNHAGFQKFSKSFGEAK